MKFKSIFFALIIVFSTFTAVFSQSEPFRFAVNYSEFANLTYQLDCLNDLTYCTKEDYEALWQKEFLKNDEDKKTLESWREIRNRYQTSFEIEKDLKFPLERRSTEVSLNVKIQIAGLQAKNLDDYLTKLDLLVIPYEREKFAQVIKRFEPRFAEWWKKEAEPKGATYAKKTETLLAKENVKSNISKFYNFYQPSLPEGYLITFDLFYRPQIIKAGSGGQAVENQLLVEFFPEEHPAQRIDVVLHEFCHFMLNSVSPEKHIQLQNLFVKSGREIALPAFNLLDEGLASAFGNGMIARLFTAPDDWQRYLKTDLTFYNNPNIDKTGKLLLIVLDDWLAKGGKLNDENFVKIYLDAMEKAFGEKLTSPSLYLGQAYIFLDQKFDRNEFWNLRRTLHIAGLYSEQGELAKIALNDFNDNPTLSSVFIVTPQSMKSLVSRKTIAEKDFRQIQQVYKTDKKVLYSIKRNKNSYIFVIVADDIETVRKLTQDLANLPKAFVGKFNQ